MDSTYRKFYRSLFKQAGFVPAKPFNQPIYPGDFFQIRNGEMIILGNIYRKGITDPGNSSIGYGIKLNPANWNLQEGLTKPYAGRGSGSSVDGEFEFSKQILAFAKRGSFFFRATEPESVKILNWSDLEQELIIKLTQTYYSFRELYIVTECATAANWTIAIAGAENAELEIATDSENFGLVDIFGHHSSKTVQSRDIDFYHREASRKPSFFRAKKLAVQEEKLNVFISDLISEREQHYSWAEDFYKYDFSPENPYSSHVTGNVQTTVLDMLQTNELNPNTALRYFRWADISSDDIDQLFPAYGNA